MNFKIFEKTKSLFFIIYLHFDKISLKKLSHHLQICARYNYKVAQLQNYKVAQNNYKVAQKLQSCAKITKLCITALQKMLPTIYCFLDCFSQTYFSFTFTFLILPVNGCLIDDENGYEELKIIRNFKKPKKG